MSEDVENLIKDFAKKCRQEIDDFDEIKVRCGLIGPSGSGKSSLINAIAGKKISEVGVVETTTDPKEYIHKGIVFTDLPGCGTLNWPKDNYIEKLNLLTFDCFLLITAHRFTENDVFLFRELSANGKPCFVIRNMFDRAVQDGHHDNKHSESQTREIISSNIRKNLEPSCPNKVYLTSARHPAKYDLEDLLEDIAEALTGLKRQRFVADMAAYGKEGLKKKRKVATELIPPYAGLAALNGLNPIPGLDFTVDLKLLKELSRKIAGIYGLEASQFEYFEKLLNPEAIKVLLAKIAQFTAKFLAKEGLTLLLKKIATRTTAKQASKWVPYVGPLIAAGIGWKATFLLGEQLVDEAEELAQEILDEIINVSVHSDDD